MLGFFLDSGLTRPITTAAPKRFFAPTAGLVEKTGTVYLGDPYSALLTEPASIGAVTLHLSNVNEFLDSGSAVVDAQTISYTGVSGLTLTGVTGVVSDITTNSVIVPSKQWSSRSNITVYSSGPDTSVIRVGVGEGGSYSFPGMPYILSSSGPILMGAAAAMAIGLEVTVPAGPVREFTNWIVSTSPFYPEPAGFSGSIPSTDFGVTPTVYGYINQQNQALPQHLRLLPVNRNISNPPAGFILGEYTWRDDTEIDAAAIIPTNWLTDPAKLGNQLFIPGIGQEDDLKPLRLSQINDSIYLTIDPGFYFTGPNGYYLPATPQLDILSSLTTVLQLTKTPEPTIPMFVGTYALDSQGFYEKNLEYRYKTAAAVGLGTGLPEYYYTLDRTNNTITLNTPQPLLTLFVGTISGEPTDYFDIPIFPVALVESVYIPMSDGTKLYGINWTVDYDLGRITITAPSGIGPSIVGATDGQVVMISCAPAVAVLYETGVAQYETGVSEPRVLDTIDLNPAFSGISGGMVYLQHSRQEVGNLVLSCDKPQIQVPATLSSIIGLIAYGPVYFNGDYALLTATAYSDVPGQVIQGAELVIVPDVDSFTGTINGLDPLTHSVTGVTGADGTANFVFRPSPSYGLYIPTTAGTPGSVAGLATTSIADDTIVLPEPIPISQLYSAGDAAPWLVTLYTVANNNPVLGMVGADTTLGQVPWTTSGTPGDVNYQTNGELDPVTSPSLILLPSQLLDIDGNNYTSMSFDGNVVSIVYPQAVPTGATIGAYFVSFLQRAVLKVAVVDSNVESNSIMLQMANPSLINDDVWLILNDSIRGILNQYRVGYGS